MSGVVLSDRIITLAPTRKIKSSYVFRLWSLIHQHVTLHVKVSSVPHWLMVNIVGFMHTFSPHVLGPIFTLSKLMFWELHAYALICSRWLAEWGMLEKWITTLRLDESALCAPTSNRPIRKRRSQFCNWWLLDFLAARPEPSSILARMFSLPVRRWSKPLWVQNI